jgi:hypothetical protein
MERFVTHDDNEFDNFDGGETPMRILVGVCFRETFMIRAYLQIDGWMDA